VYSSFQFVESGGLFQTQRMNDWQCPDLGQIVPCGVKEKAFGCLLFC